MSVLRAAPYSLPYDTLIKIRGRAHNQNGIGAYSVVNSTGARIQTIPIKPDSPSEGANTSDSQIEIIIPESTTKEQKGGDVSIVSYKLEVFNGSTWDIV